MYHWAVRKLKSECKDWYRECLRMNYQLGDSKCGNKINWGVMGR